MVLSMKVNCALKIVLLLFCSVQLAFSQSCSRKCDKEREQCKPDCSSVPAAVCAILDNGTFTSIVDPEPNTRSCYRTCISQPPGSFTICQANHTGVENDGLVRLKGFGKQNTSHSHFKIFSPNFNKLTDYNNNALCRFHLLCNTGDHKDAILTVTFQDHALEKPQPDCGSGQQQCVDSVKMKLYGATCTTCGTGMHCAERSDSPILPSSISIPGDASFMVRFRANRNARAAGFEFVTQCVEKQYFFSKGCTNPEPSILKRKREVDKLDKYFPHAFHRMRRSGRVVRITVATDSAVSYNDFTVRVFRGNEWLYKFQNIRYFQVYNFVEGYQTFYRNASEGREFPGFGTLMIGKGMIHYVQTGIEPQFLLSPAEAAIVANLYRRIANEIDQPDTDISDSFDEGESGPRQPTIIPPKEIDQMAREAEANGNACNGILRATSCLYQSLFRDGGASSDCDP